MKLQWKRLASTSLVIKTAGHKQRKIMQHIHIQILCSLSHIKSLTWLDATVNMGFGFIIHPVESSFYGQPGQHGILVSVPVRRNTIKNALNNALVLHDNTSPAVLFWHILLTINVGIFNNFLCLVQTSCLEMTHRWHLHHLKKYSCPPVWGGDVDGASLIV